MVEEFKSRQMKRVVRLVILWRHNENWIPSRYAEVREITSHLSPVKLSHTRQRLNLMWSVGLMTDT